MYGSNTIELSATIGNPLIPAHEFTLPDRLIPYEITGHPRRGLGLGAYKRARTRSDAAACWQCALPKMIEHHVVARGRSRRVHVHVDAKFYCYDKSVQLLFYVSILFSAF